MYRKYYQRYDGGYDTPSIRSPYSQTEQPTVKPEIIVPQAATDDFSTEGYDQSITSQPDDKPDAGSVNEQSRQENIAPVESSGQSDQTNSDVNESSVNRNRHNGRNGFDLFKGGRNDFKLGHMLSRFKIDDWILIAVIIMLFQEGGAIDEMLILVLVFLFIVGL